MRQNKLPNRPQNPKLAKGGAGAVAPLAIGNDRRPPKRMAMGGVGKIRHDEATKSGQPLKKGGKAKK